MGVTPVLSHPFSGNPPFYLKKNCKTYCMSLAGKGFRAKCRKELRAGKKCIVPLDDVFFLKEGLWGRRGSWGSGF